MELINFFGRNFEKEIYLTMTTAKRFRELMDSLQINAKTLAKELGVSEATLSRIRKGTNGIKESMLIHLAENYNVSLDWLLMGRGTMLIGGEISENSSGDGGTLQSKIKELETKVEMLESFNQKLIDKLGSEKVS